MAKEGQKITTKVVIDMNSGNVLSEESFQYTGPMALCEGEGEWHEALPTDVKEWDEVKNSDSPEKFWDQMTNMRHRMGTSIRIPSGDAGEEDLAAFHAKMKDKVPGLMTTPNFDDPKTMGDLYERMGRPKEAKDYAVPEFKNSKDEPIKNLDTTVIDAFKEQAFNAGLTQKQFADAVSSFVSPNLQQQEQAVSKALSEKTALADEWGTAYDRNSKIVENFLKKTDAPESVINAVTAGGVDKTAMLWFHQLATQSTGSSDFQEDTSQRGVMTPAEATIKISEVRQNKQHPYNNKLDPGHKAAMEYVRELYLLKNPKTGKDSAPGSTFGVGVQ